MESNVTRAPNTDPFTTQEGPVISEEASLISQEAPKTKGVSLMNGKVVKCVKETHDTWSLDIDVGAENLDYIAGQFISIDPKQFPELERWARFLEKLKGKREVVRAYSLASAPHEPYLTITVKAEEYWDEEDPYPPLLSPLLGSDLLMDRAIEVQGYTGHYVLPEDIESKTEQVLHMVAGSGIVPNWALLKDDLENNRFPSLKHTMIYTNKTFGDIIYRDALFAMAEKYKERFELINLITREEDPAVHGPNFFKGRPSTEFVSRYVSDASTLRVYACGAAITKYAKKKAKEKGVPATPRFMEGVASILKDLEIDRKRFKKEVYG